MILLVFLVANIVLNLQIRTGARDDEHDVGSDMVEVKHGLQV